MNYDAKNNLPDDIDTLKKMLLERDSTCVKQNGIIHSKDKKIAILEELVRYLKFKQYGVSSERFTSDKQETLFNEAEMFEEDAEIAELQADDAESTGDTKPVEKKSKRGRCKFPDSLERKDIYHELPSEQSHCGCGCKLQEISEVTSEQLCVIPAQIYVLRHCRKKYKCNTCKEKAPIVAPMPAQPIPKSNASPELIAHIAVSKYLDGLPFYRQEKMWEREGISLPRSTQANWLIGAGKLAQPLINLFADHQQQGKVAYIDETPVQVLKEPDKPPEGKKHFWLVVGGGPPDKPIYRYHYAPSRGSDVAYTLLEGFKGTVVSDDWSVYAKVCEKLRLAHAACNDHARRKFDEAFKVDKNVSGKKKKGLSKAEIALTFYRKLYAIERRIKDLPPIEKQKVREIESMPVWDKFIVWMEKNINNVTPESKLGKALSYTYRLREKLRFYCTDGSVLISNQVAENGIRPFAIARKNFLFYDTPKGAEASANLYSLIITAKHQGLNPVKYLAYVMRELPLAKSLEDIEKLLPWAVDVNELG